MKHIRYIDKVKGYYFVKDYNIYKYLLEYDIDGKLALDLTLDYELDKLIIDDWKELDTKYN